jgi:hypothetical protein
VPAVPFLVIVWASLGLIDLCYCRNLPVVIGMKTVRYSAEFMTEVLREVTERGDGVVHVGKRLGMADIIIYFWGRPARN